MEMPKLLLLALSDWSPSVPVWLSVLHVALTSTLTNPGTNASLNPNPNQSETGWGGGRTESMEAEFWQ